MLSSRFTGLVTALGVTSVLAVPEARAQTAYSAAQTYPNRTVRIVVPFPAGGPTDILARVVAQRLSEVWGQPVVIENQPGANTAIAATRVAKMPADGYTLFAVIPSPTRACPTIRSRTFRRSRSAPRTPRCSRCGRPTARRRCRS